jgi:stage II sporulation protein E
LEEPDRRDLLEERKIQENRLLISHNLCEVAQIMTRLADELFYCRPMEERYRRLLMHALRTESIYADNFCYLTEKADDTHAISMTLYTDKKGGCPAAQVADMLSVLLNRPLQLSATSPYLVEQEIHNFVFMEEAKYVALTGFCKVTKENETTSGDHYSILESEKGKMTLLLSDGTGSGEQASEDSERVMDLMENLLEAGYQTEAAVNMVNVAFLASGKEYSHPTLDICDLNLYDGCCSFYKVGGAVSFLKRGERVEQIGQGSLPLGIFRNVEMGKTERQLQDGDYLILVTDGVLDALGEGNYEEIMERAIAELPAVSPGEIAEKLMNLALCSCGGHIRDDMTVLVAGIWENAAV